MKYLVLETQDCYFTNKLNFDLDLQWPNDLIGVIDLEKGKAIYEGRFGGPFWSKVYERANDVYKGFQVQGVQCKKDVEGDEYIQSCSDEEADFWSLYGIFPHGQSVQSIGDFDSKEAAETVMNRIIGYADLYHKK